ncbi:MAG: transcription-repair coupling factor [Clostridia bacterium]|nr:transcription-repair coupling factor [Clostridia bacterium]
MLSLSDLLHSAGETSKIFKALKAGECPIVVSGLSRIHKAQLIAAIRRLTNRPIVCIFADDFAALNMINDIETLSGEQVSVLSNREFTFYNVERASHEYEHNRLSALYAMATGTSPVVLTSLTALAQCTLPPSLLKDSGIFLKSGKEYDLSDLTLKFTNFGYTRVEMVEAPGQFAIRGGILDFFSPGAKNPVRVEFWGDEIDAMGEFDTDSQRRIVNLQSTLILPSRETFLTPDLTAALCEKLIKVKAEGDLKNTITEDLTRLNEGLSFPAIDRYLPLSYDEFATGADYIPENAIILVDDFYKVREVSDRYIDQHHEDIKTLLEAETLLPSCTKFVADFSALYANLFKCDTLFLDSFLRSTYPKSPRSVFNITAKQLPSYNGNVEVVCQDIESYINDGYRVVLLCTKRENSKLLKDALDRYNISAGIDFGLSSLPESGHVIIADGNLSAGFEYPDLNLALFTEGSIIRKKSPRHKKSDSSKQKITSYQDLSVGCLVVHETHGIGRFAGIEKIRVDNVEKDYIKVIYAGTDTLFVPVTGLDLLSKYIGAGDNPNIKLSRLGGGDWERAKARAKGAARDLAEQLIKLYAERENTPGYAFPEDCTWQREFEDGFEFRETDDQLRCVSEIKTDMEKSRPMDRLLCGDVGFGKTEVALRAIMKCILGGKQAAILVPTTVLAQQHFVTARRRFANYPVKIAQLSRFMSAAKNRETLRLIKSGGVDLVIGTHKLLQKNVEFKNLGLLIVDEEQRFGVAHKERLKELSKNIDVLTLTATPIPRTLNMALSGIRDMSILEEAPNNRHPVQTYVFEHDWNVVADAIRREVSRGGQVYYLHNRVETIEVTAAKIARLLPDVSIDVAHGKMNEDELSDVMSRMAEGEVQVLVCTTIIETGIDISNVNTLIIEDADKLGLSQLHQIRGRVGRSPRHAYAYLTYRRGKVLTDVAEKRLTAIREYAEFGAGFKIAMRDLEIRGAGNILGAEQSGHMISVGYDMYLKLLEEAVNEAQDKPTVVKTECSVDLTVSANIPEKYIPSPEQRIDLYRRIAALSDDEERDDLIDELCDRFGEPPKQILTLMEIALLRREAAEAGFADVSQKDKVLKFTPAEFDLEALSKVSALDEYAGKVMLNAGKVPFITLKLVAKDTPNIAREFIRKYRAAKKSE